MLRRLQAFIALLIVPLMLLNLMSPRALAAEPAAISETQAIELLQFYRIVRGDPNGDLALNRQLTRAEASALFIRVMGKENLAPLLRDQVPFFDAVGHWGAGEIAAASTLGLMKGDGNGMFRPNADITYAEVLTVLLRIVAREPAGAWTVEGIMAAAARLNLVPAGAFGNAPAIRARLFWSLASAVSQVKLNSGRTALQTYVDNQPPILRVDALPSVIASASVSVTGTAMDALGVRVNGTTATYNAVTGQFSGQVNLVAGGNAVLVEAFDGADNVSSQSITITRQGNVTTLQVTGPAALKPGQSARVEITARDAQNNVLTQPSLQFQVQGSVATFDEPTRTLTAKNTPGTGTLIVTAGTVRTTYTFTVGSLSARAAKLKISDVNGGRAPGLDKQATVKVQVLDDDDKAVTDDFARTVTLSLSGLTGATVLSRSAETVAGVATFTITGTDEGTGTITASSSGLTSAEVPVQFLSSPRVRLIANPTALTPDGTSKSTVSARLEDETGAVKTAAAEIVVNLDESGTDGTLSASSITIRKGSSTGANTVTFQTGLRAGTAEITGYAIGASYPVQMAQIPVIAATNGLRLVVNGPTANQVPGGAGATVNVKVVNANGTTVSGAYAFQIDVATSNRETETNGLPDGLDLVMSNSTYRPIYGGGTDAIVGRTYNGTATLKLTYDKSGTVTLTPRAVAASENGYNNSTGFGPAISTEGMSTVAGSITFAGAPARIELTADSVLGNDQPGVAVSGAKAISIRARILDINGAPIPGNKSDITLTRSSGMNVSRLSSTAKQTAVDGVANFTVQGTSTPGYDVYTATTTSAVGGRITVAIRDQKADPPLIAAIRGRKGQNYSDIGVVAPDDEYMEIQLEPQYPLNTNEPTNWAMVKVYRKGESSAFFTSDAVDLNEGAPVLRVPRAKLKTGTYTYQVTLNNGAGDTVKSPDTQAATAVVSAYTAGGRINSAQFDAESGKLLLSTSGLTSSGSISKAKLKLVSGSNELALGSEAVQVVSLTAASVELNLGALADQVTPDRFNGKVVIEAADGWFTTNDGAQMAKADLDSPVTPMAVIRQASLNLGSNQLTLSGMGLAGGTFDPTKLEIRGAGTVALQAADRVTGSRRDDSVVITLSAPTMDAVNAMSGNLTIGAHSGWIYTGSGSNMFKVGALDGNRPIYVAVTVSRAAYNKDANTLTITGKGFADAELAVAKLRFKYSRMTGAEWRPPANSTVVTVTDTVITLQFDAAAAAAFEQKFGGRNVYLNTDAGWLTDATGRTAAPLATDAYPFFVQ